MKRKRLIIGSVALAGLAVGGVALARVDDERASAASSTDTETEAPDTVTVEQRDLVRSEELDGTVGHGDRTTVRLTGNGTITRLPVVDDVVQFGQPLLEVDGAAVVVLPGARPAWRSMGPGMDKGEDVRQLEQALVTLGLADPAKVAVDDTWTSATTNAVKIMQKLLGMPADGRLEPSDVVFMSEVGRIARVGGNLGDAASSADIEMTGMEQSVSMSLSASKVALLGVGDTLSIELPSGDTVDGTVSEIGDAVVDDQGTVTFPVIVTAPTLGAADGIPVTVTIEIVAVKDALAVPAEALLGLAEGGYAVEVPNASSPTGTRLVAVEVGTFADDYVEITGDVAAGDQVVVP